jgi:hypothetical protein
MNPCTFRAAGESNFERAAVRPRVRPSYESRRAGATSRYVAGKRRRSDPFLALCFLDVSDRGVTLKRASA